MNVLRVLWVGLVASSISWGASLDDMHAFTDSQGRAVEARITYFDAQRGLVELQLKNKRKKKVKPSIFSQKDQDYIRDWAVVSEFMSSRVRMDVEKEVVRQWDERLNDTNRSSEEIAYRVELNNRSKLDLMNLEGAFNIFYEQEKLTNTGQISEEGFSAGAIPVSVVRAGQKLVVKTGSATIYKQRLAGNFGGYIGGMPTNQSGKIRGVWIKLSITTSSGLSAERSESWPKSVMEKYQWKSENASKKTSRKKRK